MPSPSAASLPVKTSSYIVPVSAAHCHCPSNIKRTCRRLDTCLIQGVSHAAVHWSARTVVRQMRSYMQRVGGRPTARTL